MYITHDFAHPETLTRARYWLTRLGFDPSRIEVLTDRGPRIVLRVDLPEAVEAELLFAALESSDPDGPPSFWESAHPLPTGSAPIQFERRSEERPHDLMVLGWHPPDSDLLTDPRLRELCEILGH
jgi:hypothetical protein